MATVTFETEHARSLGRALAALEAERAACERWGVLSVELALAVDDVTELRDRMLAELEEIRRPLAAHNVVPFGRWAS